jgi:Plavaka transposase
MRSGDGIVRHTHPIFAAFVGNYPEQLLITCCKYGHCLKCTIKPILLGEDIQGTPHNLQEVLDALNTIDDGPTAYAQACATADICPFNTPSGAISHSSTFSAR